MLDWEKLFKRYVWDDQTTPYLIPVAKLHRGQADHEIFISSLFLGILFGIVALASVTEAGPLGRSLGVAFYAFSVVCAAVVFGMTKSYQAALYLSATPLVGLVYLILVWSERELVDTVLVAVVLLVLARYAIRLVAVARAYPDLPESTEEPDTPKRRRLF